MALSLNCLLGVQGDQPGFPGVLGIPSAMLFLVSMFRVIRGLKGVAGARTGNRKSQHRVPDPARKPPDNAWPLPHVARSPSRSYSWEATTAAHRPPKGPARRNFPRMTAKPKAETSFLPVLLQPSFSLSFSLVQLSNCVCDLGRP